MILKKRQVLTATLIIALCAAVTVNWYFTKPQNSDLSDTTSVDEAVTGNLGDTLFVAGTTAASAEEEDAESSLVNNEVKVTSESTDSEKYFSDAKLKRTQTYDETVAQIEKILTDDNLEQSEKSSISVMLSDYKNDMKVQTDAENLISAKTGKECLVVINEENCQVILEKNTLNDTLILQISEIIEKNTDMW